MFLFDLFSFPFLLYAAGNNSILHGTRAALRLQILNTLQVAECPRLSMLHHSIRSDGAGHLHLCDGLCAGLPGARPSNQRQNRLQTGDGHLNLGAITA